MISHLTDASVRSLALAALAATLLRVLRKRTSPAVAHAAWTAVLCGMTLLVALAPALPPLPLRLIPVLPKLNETPALLWLDKGSSLDSPPAQTPSPTVPAPARFGDVAFGIYFAGVLFFAARLATGWVQIRRLLVRAKPAEYPDVSESPDLTVPVTIGWIRPKILLPPGWREWGRATLDTVLAHERAHIRRLDPAVALLARLNRCVFWFHPLAWWLDYKLAVLAEQACDDAVMAASGDERRYARVLFEMAAAVERARGRIDRHALGMASHVHERVDRVLEGRSVSRPGISVGMRLVLLMGSMPLIYAAGTVRLAQQRSPAPFEFPQVLAPAAPKLIVQQRTPVSPQQPPPSIAVPRQIRVSAIVQEPAGRYVTGLSSANFRIFEDGAEQPIAAFYDTSPVSLAVVINEDPAGVETLAPDLTLLRQRLGADDELFLVYSRGVVPKLASSVEELLTIARSVAAGGSENSFQGMDAVYLAADRLKTAKHARHVLVVPYAGIVDFSRRSQAEVNAMLRSAEVQVYAGRRDLAAFATELQNQYVLVYNHPEPARAGYRKIEVRLENVGGMPPLTVHALQGYSVP